MITLSYVKDRETSILFAVSLEVGIEDRRSVIFAIASAAWKLASRPVLVTRRRFRRQEVD
jgi:hypothetical protein